MGLKRMVISNVFAALILPVALLDVHAQTPAPCLANLTSPLFVSVTGQLGDLIDDQCEHVYVTNTSNNQVEAFSLQTNSLNVSVGSSPVGLDASPDGKTLYVANSGGSNLSVVDLTQGMETDKISVPAGFSSDTPFSLAVANNGLVLFSTTFAGSGFGGRMMQLDPSSTTVNALTSGSLERLRRSPSSNPAPTGARS